MLAENKQFEDLPIEAQNIWASLEDIPTNDNDEIERAFLHFPIGTERWDIYLWFEKKYECIVGNIL